MADIKVTQGSFIITNGNTSKTLTAGTDYPTPASASSAFVRIVSSQNHSIADATNGAVEDGHHATVRIDYPTGDITDDIRFTRAGSTDGCLVCWEVWEYVGASGGANEFIVRGIGELSFAYADNQEDSSAISGISSASDCVPFVTFAASAGTPVAYYPARWRFRAEMINDGDDKVRGERGSATGTPTKYMGYACVEFTGSNWTVQTFEHAYSNPGNEETESISDVGATTRAFLICQLSAGAIQDYSVGHEVYLNSTTQVGMRVDANALGSPVARVYVVSNSQTGTGAMEVRHISGSRAGAQSDPDSWTESITDISALTDAAVFLTCRAEENYATGTVPVLAELTAVDTVSLDRVESQASGDDIYYRVSVVQFPTAPTAAFIPKVMVI